MHANCQKLDFVGLSLGHSRPARHLRGGTATSTLGTAADTRIVGTAADAWIVSVSAEEVDIVGWCIIPVVSLHDSSMKQKPFFAVPHVLPLSALPYLASNVVRFSN